MNLLQTLTDDLVAGRDQRDMKVQESLQVQEESSQLERNQEEMREEVTDTQEDKTFSLSINVYVNAAPQILF